MKHSLLVLLIVFCVASFTKIHAQSFSTPGRDSIELLMKKYHVPIVAIGIIENGKIKSEQLFGELADHKKADKHTFFNIASLTKPLVTMTTMKLVSDGQWDLDEPLSHYWVDPDVKDDPRHLKLTTRHVLSHQTGLPNWRGHEPGQKLSFAFEPGTDWKYSGEGFEYLSHALAKKFNKPFERITDSLIFKPFKMKETKFYWDKNTDPARYAGRYHEDGTPFEHETWSEANPSNLVLTTVHDYSLFAVNVMAKTGMTDAVYKEMSSGQVTLKNGNAFGLGWSLIKGLPNDRLVMMHGGRNPGINTIIVLLPDSKDGIVIFTNGDGGDKVYDVIIRSSAIGRQILDRRL